MSTRNILINLFQHPDQELYYYDSEYYKVADAIATIDWINSLIPENTTRIGISVHSPFLLLCLVVSAWENRATPILLDPCYKEELSILTSKNPPLLIFTDRQEKQNVGIYVTEQRESLRSSFVPIIPDDEATCLAFLTSGSEGQPKVVYKKTRQILLELDILNKLVPDYGSSLSICFVPPYHIYGFLFGVLLPLLRGMTSHFLSGRIIPSFWNMYRQNMPGMVISSPIHYKYMVTGDYIVQKPRTCFISSGAPLSEKLIDLFQQKTGLSIMQVYGSTETGGIAYRNDGGEWNPFEKVSVRCKKRTGLIEVQSPWASNISQIEWETTADAGEIKNRGFILLGRAQTLLKFRGKRLSSIEVENALLKIDGIGEAAVLTIEQDDDDHLYAFLVLHNNSDFNEDMVRTYLQKYLAAYKIPRFFRIVKKLPKREMGKIDYEVLRYWIKSSRF